jgi:ribosomal protein L34E
MSCNSRDCANNKHCFKPAKHKGQLVGDGECRGCGERLVDFARVRSRDVNDIDHTVRAMRLELIRDEFWCRKFNDKALTYSKKKGMKLLCEQVPQKIMSNIGDAADAFDGRRVPVDQEKMTNPYEYAFHATATCCRRCAQYWHGIPVDRPLTLPEVDYLSALVRYFLEARLNSIPPEPHGQQQLDLPPTNDHND